MTHLLLAPRAISTLVTNYLEVLHTSASSSGLPASQISPTQGCVVQAAALAGLPHLEGKIHSSFGPDTLDSLNLQIHPKAPGKNVSLNVFRNSTQNAPLCHVFKDLLWLFRFIL